MKIKNNIPDELKTFCQTVWIFSGVLISLMCLLNICYWSVEGALAWLYDLLGFVMGFLLPVGCVLSVVWLIVIVIWCVITAKKENNKKIFLHPVVVVTNIISIVNFIWIFSFIAF